MSGVNKVILVGHLGRDPDVRLLENGAKVATFSLATSETFTRDGKKVEQTEWHNIVLWRGLADIAERFLAKGKLVYLEGKLRTRSWEDKDGNKRYQTEVIADNFTMLGRKSDNGSSDTIDHQEEYSSSVVDGSSSISSFKDDPEMGLPF